MIRSDGRPREVAEHLRVKLDEGGDSQVAEEFWWILAAGILARVGAIAQLPLDPVSALSHSC
jgi:hypothetical protein